MLSGIKISFSSTNSGDNIFFIITPNIKGITIKKEKRAEYSLSIPNKTEVDIVAPDLEIPGRIATQGTFDA